MTGKSMELVDTAKRRANVACLRETKWKGKIAKELTDGCKLYNTRKNNAMHGGRLVVDKEL